MIEYSTPNASSSGNAPPGGSGSQQSPPSWLPQNFWDGRSGQIKPEFGAHYAEARKSYENYQELAARDPDEIEFALPLGLDAPPGYSLAIDENDPRIAVIREMAIKKRWPQEVVNELVLFDAKSQIDAHNAEQARVASERAKLGERAKDRLDAVTNWAKGLRDQGAITPDEFQEIRVIGATAAGISALEKIIAKFNGSTSAQGGSSPQLQQSAKPLEDRWYGGQGNRR